MLIVSRRADEAIQINLADGADGTLTLNDLFANGPIEIMLLGSSGRRVKVGIAAPPELSIRRKDRDDAANGSATEHTPDQAPAGKTR
jgi:sRNA-binding carbon storage regulator CsrA